MWVETAHRTLLNLKKYKSITFDAYTGNSAVYGRDDDGDEYTIYVGTLDECHEVLSALARHLSCGAGLFSIIVWDELRKTGDACSQYIEFEPI